jgi:hypothetical protein
VCVQWLGRVDSIVVSKLVSWLWPCLRPFCCFLAEGVELPPSLPVLLYLALVAARSALAKPSANEMLLRDHNKFLNVILFAGSKFSNGFW